MVWKEQESLKFAIFMFKCRFFRRKKGEVATRQRSGDETRDNQAISEMVLIHVARSQE